MLAGGLLAMVSMTLCLLLARQIWLTAGVAQEPGLYGVSMLFVLFVGGVYVFSLGYELNDAGRAVRLTLIIAVVGVVGLALMIGAFAALAWIKAGAGATVPDRQIQGALGLLGGPETDEGPDAPKHHLEFSVLCQSCDNPFIPVPPDAVCPWCDAPYFQPVSA